MANANLKSRGTEGKREVLWESLDSATRSDYKRRLGKCPGIRLTEHAKQRAVERGYTEEEVIAIARKMGKKNICRVCEITGEVVMHNESKDYQHAQALVMDLASDCWTVITIWEYPKGRDDSLHVR